MDTSFAVFMLRGDGRVDVEFYSDRTSVSISAEFETGTVQENSETIVFSVLSTPVQFRAKVLLCLAFCRRNTTLNTPRARQLTAAMRAFPTAWSECFFADLASLLEGCHHLPLPATPTDVIGVSLHRDSGPASVGWSSLDSAISFGVGLSLAEL
jgi:hypothetical protein